MALTAKSRTLRQPRDLDGGAKRPRRALQEMDSNGSPESAPPANKMIEDQDTPPSSPKLAPATIPETATIPASHNIAAETV